LNPCKVCDADNPNGLLLCKVCKAPLTQTNPSYEQPLLTKPKMAVVNIDRALLDNTNFETDRKAKRLKKGSAEHTRMITEKLEMQTVSPEAKQFLDSLVDQNLVIGFISEKHQGHMSRQKDHLQNLGLPIMIDSSGVLLKSGSDSKILNDWGSRYDIQYYFGDAVKTARKKGIPGTYDTVNGYIGAPIKNPAIMMEETPAPYALVNPDFRDPRTGVEARGISEEAVEMALMIALQESGTAPEVAKNEARQVLETLAPQATLQGDRQTSTLYGDKVVIQGDRNTVNGYAMESVVIQGDRNKGQITVPIGAQVKQMGSRNSINIRRVPVETFATEIYTTLTGQRVQVDRDSIGHVFTGTPQGIEDMLLETSEAPVSGGSLISQLPPYENAEILSKRGDNEGWITSTGAKVGGKLTPVRPGDRLMTDDEYVAFKRLTKRLVNPPPKPKTKKMKNGKSRREPVKSYINRFMKSKKQVADFPDRRQRYAVGMTYAEKFYGRKIYSNPPLGKDAEGGDIMLESEEAADMAAILKAEAEAAFIEKFGADMAGLTGSPPPPSRAPVSSGSLIHYLPPWREEAKKVKGYQLFIDRFGEDEVPNMHNYSFMPASSTGPAYWTMNIFRKMARPPKTNPSSKTKKKKSKKVKAAEKAYKDFHGGKKPKKVETVSVEFSDVWYCLGPVWCIGYMSDKEGFGEQQKYIHHTNEESKDGDFPMLYATMPESGEQMFMIKGGTMTVSARDGLDWLID
jgi:hypothetical protein